MRALYQQIHRRCVVDPRDASHLCPATDLAHARRSRSDRQLRFDRGARHAGMTQLRAGALDAFYDYQASRVPLPQDRDGNRPTCFDHGFRWGGAAIYQLDLRSERYTHDDTTSVIAPAQLARLTGFLAKERLGAVARDRDLAAAGLPPRLARACRDAYPGQQEEREPIGGRQDDAPGEREQLFRLLIDHAPRAPRAEPVAAQRRYSRGHCLRDPVGEWAGLLSADSERAHRQGEPHDPADVRGHAARHRTGLRAATPTRRCTS